MSKITRDFTTKPIKMRDLSLHQDTFTYEARG